MVCTMPPSPLPVLPAPSAAPIVLDASLALGSPIRRRFAGRAIARELAVAIPDGEVVLDFRGVYECTPSFFVELLTLRPGVRPARLGVDGETSWQVACCRCPALHSRLDRRGPSRVPALAGATPGA